MRYAAPEGVPREGVISAGTEPEREERAVPEGVPEGGTPAGRERLDVILVRRGYAGSRARATDMILAGNVYVDGRRAGKAGAVYEAERIELRVQGQDLKYVGRGGLKLEKALEEWQIGLEGMACMDIGASTGGFTDCMLCHGAARVYAIDVGKAQLAEKLRQDPRVVSMEQRNFRYMTEGDLPERPDFAGADVSFISLTKILLPAWELLREGGQMVCLVKPQFEAGRGLVGKNGVVKSPAVHRQVLEKIIDYGANVGFRILHLGVSPVRGSEGNIEYLLHLAKEVPKREGALLQEPSEAEGELSETPIGTCGNGRETALLSFWQRRIREIVEAAHSSL